MRLSLDEHYSQLIAVELRRLGHDVDCVKERPELVSLSDADLLATMTGERRALLTEDVGHFKPLINQLAAAGDIHYGFIFSSNRSMPRSRNTVGAFVDQLDAILKRHPKDDDFVNKIEWLGARDN